MKIADYQVRHGRPCKLSDWATSDDGGFAKKEAANRLSELQHELDRQQELLYASGTHALLVVFQAMDAAGKDSTIRSVLRPINPQGCVVTSFKAPSTLERSHDFLWRVHRVVPARGMIGVFNRSHYEDVLVARVRGLVPPKVWKHRYDQINAFEELLACEGVVIRKFYLHASKEYQHERLAKRLANPAKHWKFDPADLDDRAHWDDYMKAYGDALGRCSTPDAPWFVIPAERRWFRNLLVAEVLVDALRGLKLKHPKPAFDPATINLE